MKSAVLSALAVVVLGAGLVSAQGPAAGGQLPDPGVTAPAVTTAPVVTAPAVHSGPALGNSATGCYSPGACEGGSRYIPSGNQGSCDGCQFYASTDYLLWKIRGASIPATATVVPVGLIGVNLTDLFTNNPAAPGVAAGTPVVGFAPASITSTSTFAQGTSLNEGEHSGVRTTIGFWCDADQTFGIEASGFVLDQTGATFAAITGNSTNQFLVNTGFTRNLFLVQGGNQTLLNSFPVFAVRQTTSQLIGSYNNSLWGAELNGRCIVAKVGCLDVGMVTGFRYLQYLEHLTTLNNVRLFRPTEFPETQGDANASLSQDLTFRQSDNVRVRNQFFGGQVGADFDAKFGAWFLYTRVTAAVGTMHQAVDINGTTQVINNDPAATRQSPANAANAGGLLFSPLDNGSHNRNRFAFIPAINAKLGYQVCSWLRAYVGYDGLYMGHVARAANLSSPSTLNTTVRVANSTNQVNVSQPSLVWRDSDVWVQGLNFGMEVRY